VRLIEKSQLSVRDFPLKADGRLFVEKALSSQACKQVHQEISGSPVPGMFHLANVFQFVVDGLNDRTFPQQYPVPQTHKPVFHILLDACYQMDTIVEK
jgi:hypothetical protein